MTVTDVHAEVIEPVKLTDKQQRLVDEFFVDLDKKAAFFRAGYTCSNDEKVDQRVWRAFESPLVKRAIALRNQDMMMTRRHTPLDVMLDNMEHWFAIAKNAGKDDKGAQQARIMAQAAAKDAAPYVHPKLQSIAVTGGLDFRNLPDDQLMSMLQSVRKALAVDGISNVEPDDNEE